MGPGPVGQMGPDPVGVGFFIARFDAFHHFPHFNGFEAYCSRTAALKSTAANPPRHFDACRPLFVSSLLRQNTSVAAPPMARVKAHNVARSIGASRRRVCLNVPFRPVGMTGCLSKSSCPLRTRPESRSPNSAAVPDSRPSPCSATFRCSPRPWRPQVRRAVRQDSCPKQAPCVWRSAAPHSSSTVSLHDTLSLKRHYTITVSHRHPKLFWPFQRNKQLANLAIRHGV